MKESDKRQFENLLIALLMILAALILVGAITTLLQGCNPPHTAVKPVIWWDWRPDSNGVYYLNDSVIFYPR